MKIKLTKILLKIVPKWFINYLWNSGFYYGTEHGKYIERKAMKDGLGLRGKVMMLHRWCEKCKDSHPQPSINLSLYFSENPPPYTVEQDLIQMGSGDYE